MNILKTFVTVSTLAVTAASLSSCSDSETYAELLTDENHYVNSFLADQIVIKDIPADSVFETGKDAPYYRVDEDGNLYMQVVDPGTPGNMVKSDELIYFRYIRYNLSYYADGELPDGDGNKNDLSYGNFSFRYGNYSLQSSYQWGTGIQRPLDFLPVDCQVNIVIKSQYGPTDELSYVTPFLYELSYYRPKI
jgi:hypothetical protein